MPAGWTPDKNKKENKKMVNEIQPHYLTGKTNPLVAVVAAIVL
jgi:hypothetical protein